MSRIAFIFRTDVHVSDKSPVSWKGDYPAEIWSNLTQIGDLARKHNATAVLDGGDFFHVKTPGRNSHALVIRTIDIHAKYPCPTWSIEGNHDISANDLDSLDHQPLGVLYSSGIFEHLQETVFEEGSLRVRVVGVPYSKTRSLKDILAIQKQPGDTHLIAIVHALAGMNPPAHVEEIFGEPVFSYPELMSPNGPDVMCFGHWHRDQGIEVIQGKYFVNQGAVSRGALVRENLERIPKVALIVLDDTGVSVEPILLHVAPANEVFDLEKKERRDHEVEIIDQFVSALQENTAFDPSAEVSSNIQQLGYAPDIRSLAMDYLEQARINPRGK